MNLVRTNLRFLLIQKIGIISTPFSMFKLNTRNKLNQDLNYERIIESSQSSKYIKSASMMLTSLLKQMKQNKIPMQIESQKMKRNQKTMLMLQYLRQMYRSMMGNQKTMLMLQYLR